MFTCGRAGIENVTIRNFDQTTRECMTVSFSGGSSCVLLK